MIRAILEHWPIFLAGVAFAFLASTALTLGWWFLILTRGRSTPEQVNEQFLRVRESIRQSAHARRN